MMTTGGSVFWILVAMAVVAVVTYVERLLDLRRAQINYQDFLKGVVNVLEAGSDDEALAICDDVSAPVAQVVATAIRHHQKSTVGLREAVDSQGHAEVGRLERRLAVLAIIGQIAPIVGLLGTVIGFIKTVMIANSQEIVVRADLLNGAMEALVSAAIGLAVAIVVSVFYGSVRVRLDRIVVELEAAASQIVGYFLAKAEKERSK